MQKYTVKTDDRPRECKRAFGGPISEAPSYGVQEEEGVFTKGCCLGGFVLINRLGHNHFFYCACLSLCI